MNLDNLKFEEEAPEHKGDRRPRRFDHVFEKLEVNGGAVNCGPYSHSSRNTLYRAWKRFVEENDLDWKIKTTKKGGDLRFWRVK